MSSTLSAALSGSPASSGGGRRAVFTAQKLQPRVQVSPISISVAVPPLQHSSTLGQRASSQTVCSPRSRSGCLRPTYFAPPGGRIFSQGGLGPLTPPSRAARPPSGGPTSAPASSDARGGASRLDKQRLRGRRVARTRRSRNRLQG